MVCRAQSMVPKHFAGAYWPMRPWLAYSRPMTDAPDIEQLARRYLDLWQDQTAALINDPALAEAMGRTYALMSKGAAAFFAAAGSAGGDKEEGGADFADVRAAASAKPASTPPGTTPLAAASGGPSLESADLADRLVALEGRVLHLEASLAAIGGGPKAPTRKGRR